jgi:hypothetical protein
MEALRDRRVENPEGSGQAPHSNGTSSAFLTQLQTINHKKTNKNKQKQKQKKTKENKRKQKKTKTNKRKRRIFISIEAASLSMRFADNQ